MSAPLKVAESMSCADFFDACLDNDWDSFADEMYWSDSYNSDACFDWLKARADREGVILTDVEEFEYDKFFWNTYRDTEKGLS
jgi:hypothetical protein